MYLQITFLNIFSMKTEKLKKSVPLQKICRFEIKNTHFKLTDNKLPFIYEKNS